MIQEEFCIESPPSQTGFEVIPWNFFIPGSLRAEINEEPLSRPIFHDRRPPYRTPNLSEGAIFRANAIFVSIENLPSDIWERAPTVHTSVQRGLPSQRSQVMVFFISGWMTGAP